MPVRDTGVGFLPLIMGAVSLATGVYSSIKKQKEEKKAKEKAEDAAAAKAAAKAEPAAKAEEARGAAKMDPTVLYLLGGAALFLVTIVAIRE
jgi:uncharacterized protein HemX